MINRTPQPPNHDTVNTYLFALVLVLIFILALHNANIPH